MLRFYTALWIILTLLLGYEYWCLNHLPHGSILFLLQKLNLLDKQFSLSPSPGRPLSMLLGYAGFGIMLLTNIYILKKKFGKPSPSGNLNGWLDFHILCGLIGPTFIVFHCNFTVRGLVSISFWSMVVSFLSGIVGRYFYVNLLSQKRDSEILAKKYWSKFLTILDQNKISPNDQRVEAIRINALAFAGLKVGTEPVGVFTAFFYSMIGDLRLALATPKTLSGLPEKSRYLLEEYAINERRSQYLTTFQTLMGYWHAFHKPFAIFMYVVAIIHIASALMFGVSK